MPETTTSETKEVRFESLQQAIDLHLQGNGLPPLKLITFFDTDVPVPQWLAVVSDSEGNVLDSVLRFNSSCLILQFDGEEVPLLAIPLLQTEYLLELDNVSGADPTRIQFNHQMFYPTTMELIRTEALSYQQLINNIMWLPLETVRFIWRHLKSKRVKL